MMKTSLFAISAVVATLGAGAASAAVTICDASFETPRVPAGGYQYGVQQGAQHSSNGADLSAPRCSSFGNGAGIQANGSAWGFANAPSGTQTAFLQSYNDTTPGQITLSVAGLTGSRYQLVFDVSNRSGYGVDPVTVSYSNGGSPISLGTYTPTSDNWTQVRSAWFDPSATSGTLTFSVPINAGDADIGIDAISMAVPEPLTWIMMIMGVGMIGAGLRYNRRNGVAATA